ncbi:MAG TPA: PAS domain-containing protein, partial [Pyrinomonadaceae bacterium]
MLMEHTDFSSIDTVGNSLLPAQPDSSEILSAAMLALPDAFYLFDAEKHLSRTNRAGALLENMDAEALMGRRCCEMFWRVEDAPECLVERALAGGEKVEVEILAGDRPTLMIVVPIRDAQDVLTGSVMVVARDISELRRAEAEAFEHKAFMASLADLVPDEIYALDTDGRITWMNERAEGANGHVPTALVGRKFDEIVAQESRDAVSANIKRTLAGEDTQSEIQAVRAGDEALRFVEAHSSPLWKDGSVAGALIFLRDLTER